MAESLHLDTDPTTGGRPEAERASGRLRDQRGEVKEMRAGTKYGMLRKRPVWAAQAPGGDIPAAIAKRTSSGRLLTCILSITRARWNSREAAQVLRFGVPR